MLRNSLDQVEEVGDVGFEFRITVVHESPEFGPRIGIRIAFTMYSRVSLREVGIGSVGFDLDDDNIVSTFIDYVPNSPPHVCMAVGRAG